MVRVEDFDGGVSTISYNALNRPEVFRDKEGRETRRRYDRMWNLSEEQSPTGAITRYHYDEDNRLCLLELCSREGEEAALVYAYTHDCNGNLLSAKAGDHTMKEGGEALCVVSYTYDALNRPVTETDAEGNTTTYVYNREGQMESITDGAGNRRSFAYNAGGECISETDEEGNTTTYTYHASGQISGVKDPAGRETSYEYLPGGRLKTIRYPDGRFLSHAYDKNGNLIKKQDSEGYEITYAYDCMNRLVRAEDNRGRKKGYAYDAMGNVTGMTDALGNTTKYAYTISGKLSAVTDAAGARTEYRYDALDNLVCVCQKGKNGEEERITRYVRDPFGRTETIIDALGGEEHYTYDALGRVISKTDREGFVTRNSYDGRGNLSGILYGDGKRVELEYDALSRLIQVKDWLGTTSITRDRKGNPVRVLDYEGRETRYEWGSLGEKKSMTYPDGRMVHFSYDGMLRPETMGIHRKGEEEQTIRYRYDEAGRLSGKEFPEGLKTTWLYNREGQLEELLHEDREGILDHYSYTYDAMGNKTGITRKRRGAEAENGSYGYAYDVLGRLTEVEKDGEVLRRYRYDSFGNRVGMEEAATGRTKDYRYDVLNRLTRLEEQYRGEHHFTEYGYDRRGNLTEEWKDGVLLHGYTYGADNRLQTSRNWKGEKVGYRYNGLGDRTGKTVTGRGGERREESYLLVLTRPYNNLLAVTGGEKEQYFYWDGNVTAMEEEGRLHYYFPDDLGSPLRVSGFSEEPGTGRETGSYLTYGYDEFGQDLYREMEEEGIPNPYMETGEGQPFGYTGYRYDRVGGSYFAQAREYRGELGRFCAEDVLQGNGAVPETMNRYSYCWNSPLGLVDLDGLYPGYTAAAGRAAHTKLQTEFLKHVSRHPNYWGDTEVFVTNYSRTMSGTGYIDILLKVNGWYEVYEIKPIYYHNWVDDEVSGKAQRRGYISAIESEGLTGKKENVNIQGTTFNPNGWRVKSDVPGYDFVYTTYPDSPGMIYWSYKPRKKREKVTAKVSEKSKNNVWEEVVEGAKSVGYLVGGVGAGAVAVILLADNFVHPACAADDQYVSECLLKAEQWFTYFWNWLSGAGNTCIH